MKTSTANNRLSHVLPNALSEVDSLVDQFFGPSGPRLSSWRVPAAVWESDEQLLVELDAPGVKLDDVEVTYEKGSLTVKLKRSVSEHDGKLLHNERGHGEVTRTVALPETVDPESIVAKLTDGVLSITVGKHPEALPKRIDVQTA